MARKGYKIPGGGRSALPFGVLRNLRENLGYDDTNVDWLTDKEIKRAGFASRKDLIRWNINDFLNNPEEVKSYVRILRDDMENTKDLDFMTDINKNYKATADWLEKHVAAKGASVG